MSRVCRRKLDLSRILTIAAFLSIVHSGLAPRLFAQLTPPGTPVASGNLTPDVVAGRVVNAVTGSPIPRTLVQMNGRAMLTDQEGRFRFDQPGQSVSSLRLTKPGFSTSPEQMDSSGDASPDGTNSGSLTLTLWPEALLVGSVTAPDGEPLSRIAVLARRSVFDEQGHHFQVAGQTQTDSHGQFRIPVTAGDYIVETQFAPRRFEREEAVLPFTFPQRLSGSRGELLHVASGEEQRLELRPGVGRTHIVSLPFDGGEEGPPPRILARSSDGSAFSTNASRSQEPGNARLSLPSGAYSLHATRFSRDGMQFGDTAVNVADRDVTASPLHLTALPSIPIDVIADTSNTQAPALGGGNRTANTPPNFMQFNLVLEPLEADPTSPFQFGIRPTQQRDGGASLAAPPGIYRLSAGLASGWYVRSATSHGTDLVREALVISTSSSPSPITLIISNQTGSLQGTVKISGAPSACWIYLVANGPALPAVIMRRSDPSGSFHITDLPPGSYRAIAFPYRHSADLQDPAVLNRFVGHVGSVSIFPGNTAILDLEAVTLKELAP